MPREANVLRFPVALNNTSMAKRSLYLGIAFLAFVLTTITVYRWFV
jgi:hypothetical protein